MVRDDVLRTLEEHRGEQISGGTLARELGVSRTAIWKAVSSLREMGFPITSAAGGGYCLDESSDALSEAGISMNLTTQYAAQHLCVLSTVDSTNNYLKQRAADLPHGYAVVADCQTAGRGRLGRSFVSPSGSGIYISLLLRPNIPLERMHLMTVGAAIAACEAIQETAGLTPDIKWVNDLYYHEKKVCGILTEAVTDFESGNIEFAVVGIGLNLYEQSGGFPEDLKGIAGALYPDQEAAVNVDRNRLAASIINHLLKETEELRLPEEYIEHNMVPGRKIEIRNGKDIRKAEALEICPDGRLKVKEKDGTVSLLSYGEVSILV